MEMSTRNGAEGTFHQWTRKSIGIRKAEELREQLLLEVVKILDGGRGERGGGGSVVLGRLWHGASCAQNVGTFTVKKAWARSVVAELEKKGKTGKKARESRSLSGTAVTCALKVYQCVVHTQFGQVNGKHCLEEFVKDGRFSVSASVKVRECYNEVEAEDEGRLSIAQDILRKSTDILRRIIAPNDGIVIAFRLSATFGGSPLGMERSSVTGGVRLVAASMIGGPRTGSWSCFSARTTEMQEFFGLMRHHREPA